MISSTSSFDRRVLRGLRPVIAGLALVILVDAACGIAFRLPDPFARFAVRPEAGKVFFLGNSMFKTAFDYEVIGQEAGLGYRPPFDAHIGHYTSLWYLYVTAGFRDVQPALVVWGFRPTYANRPAFRKREPCDVDLFRDYWDANYLAKTRSAGLSPGERFKIGLESISFLFGQRERIRARVTREINSVIHSVAGRGGHAAAGVPLQSVVDGRVSVADLVQRFGSRGAVTFGEQKVVDAGKGFITGQKADFARSFVPDIVARLAARGIPQMVVIFKPAAYTQGAVPAEDRVFVADAVQYFREHGIPYLDFVDDERVQRRHFAEGDHYNEEGRALLTAIMSEKLRTVLAGGAMPAPVRGD